MKNAIPFALNYRGVDEEVCGGGGVNERSLNKRDHGKIIEIS